MRSETTTTQVVDDDKKFAVAVDVSQFHPEELKVHLDGRELTIEGKQQHKSDNSFMERSFVRTWTLPENVDLDAIRTQLNDAGHLSIEAPKMTEGGSQRRTLTIERAPPKQ
ncbi:Hsp20/alpha crystallin family protein [Teladorsagia circumcincta]|uniref:Hsp20/alpha crystallin family protein n=1 Tax=Teladorsagia circumcincta TaxID=45464 RepID=A0A2G9UW54_TELCI|nr:Hsp20/alpha crystallin family protein [Teladorsagia circumcincta]